MLEDSHAEEDVVLWTDSQTLSNGTQLSPDVSAQDVGGTRGRREQTGQDGPAEETQGDYLNKPDLCLYVPVLYQYLYLYWSMWSFTHMVVVFPAPLCPRKEVICPS